METAIALFQAGIQHFIFSALEDTRPYVLNNDAYSSVCNFRGGPFKMPHYDCKADLVVSRHSLRNGSCFALSTHVVAQAKAVVRSFGTGSRDTLCR